MGLNNDFNIKLYYEDLFHPTSPRKQNIDKHGTAKYQYWEISIMRTTRRPVGGAGFMKGSRGGAMYSPKEHFTF